MYAHRGKTWDWENKERVRTIGPWHIYSYQRLLGVLANKVKAGCEEIELGRGALFYGMLSARECRTGAPLTGGPSTRPSAEKQAFVCVPFFLANVVPSSKWILVFEYSFSRKTETSEISLGRLTWVSTSDFPRSGSLSIRARR